LSRRLSNRIQDAYIPRVIQGLVDDYLLEGVESAYEINNGLCDNFAEDLITKLGEDQEGLYAVSVDMIFQDRDPEMARKFWEGELYETPFGIWSIRLLDMHGHPPVPLDRIEYCSSHVWVCFRGKHYDAETPYGVRNWSELPIYKKMFDSLMQEKQPIVPVANRQAHP